MDALDKWLLFKRIGAAGWIISETPLKQFGNDSAKKVAFFEKSS